MTQVFSFVDYQAQFQHISKLVQALIANQQKELVWIILEEDSRWKLSYCPVTKLAECHHIGGDNFLTTAAIYTADENIRIVQAQFVRLSNYEKDIRDDEPDEFALHLRKLEEVLPKIIEVEVRLASEGG